MSNQAKQIVVVTGASSGLGLAVARQQASNQDNLVLLVARDEEKLLSAKQSICMGDADNIRYFSADLTDDTHIQSLMKFIQQLKLPVHAFVHCAGSMYEAPLLMSKPSVIDEQYSQHVKSAILLSQGISKLMLRNKAGSIVLVSSVVAHQGSKGQSVYSAMKSALHGFVASLAAELGGFNIRVNAVAPGVINTPLVAHFSSDKKQQLAQSTALGRLGEPEEIAEVVSFLFSECSRYITGQVINVDGGLRLSL